VRLQDKYIRLQLNPVKLLDTKPCVLLADTVLSRDAVETVGQSLARGEGWWCVACSA